KKHKKLYAERYPEKLREKRKKYKEQNKHNLVYKLRKRVSNLVGISIKNNYGAKNGSSISTLPYTIMELKNHLESQFEPWMTWNNWGIYNSKTWDDNDSSTWTWQIDHIIPQSKLPYDSLDHPNFQKCWALENLRPLNAKQNC